MGAAVASVELVGQFEMSRAQERLQRTILSLCEARGCALYQVVWRSNRIQQLRELRCECLRRSIVVLSSTSTAAIVELSNQSKRPWHFQPYEIRTTECRAIICITLDMQMTS